MSSTSCDWFKKNKCTVLSLAVFFLMQQETAGSAVQRITVFTSRLFSLLPPGCVIISQTIPMTAYCNGCIVITDFMVPFVEVGKRSRSFYGNRDVIVMLSALVKSLEHGS